MILSFIDSDARSGFLAVDGEHSRLFRLNQGMCLAISGGDPDSVGIRNETLARIGDAGFYRIAGLLPTALRAACEQRPGDRAVALFGHDRIRNTIRYIRFRNANDFEPYEPSGQITSLGRVSNVDLLTAVTAMIGDDLRRVGANVSPSDVVCALRNSMALLRREDPAWVGNNFTCEQFQVSE